MGVYLSSPIRDKVSEDDDVQTLRYGASSMQGWRTSQEDAHNCCTDFDPETNTTLFACYDGHGGAEVAQYTAQHFPEYLKISALYKEGNLSKALEEGFLGFDATLKEDAVIQKLKELAGVDDDEDETEQKEESNALFEEATMPLEELLSRYGRGGAKAAAILKKEKGTFQSPALSAKKENGNAASERPANDDVKMKLENELMNGHSDNENNENIERASNLAQQQSSASSTQAASTTSPLAALRSLTSSSSQANEAQAKEETDSSSATQRQEAVGVEGSSCVDSTTPDTTSAPTAPSTEAKPATTIKSDSGNDDDAVISTKSDSSTSLSQPAATAEVETAASSSADSNNDAEPCIKPSTEKSNGTDSQPSSTTTPTSSSSTAEEPGSSSAASSSSVGAAGSSAVSAGSSSSSQSVAPESSSSSSGGSGSSSSGGSAGGSSEDTGPCSSSKQEPEAGSSTGSSRPKRKNVIPEEGEDESSFDEDEESSDEDDDMEGDEPWADGSEDSSDDDATMVLPPDLEEDEEDEDEEEEDQATSSTEEPGSDSGCTSVVALLRGRELYVANAGDSRCVLCRGGKAIDMSIDHKPEDELEHNRITKAGGRVTMDGRVNGGLNLSRAIGDHCYKRNTELSDREQMITALPDIRTTVLEEADEFMVLACDGIWNVMTSQDVVNFVSERLKAGVTKLSSICEEMFEFCLSPDTSGDGTGCDNMTCIIVCFKQDKISNSGASVKRQAESELPESTDNADLPDSKKARTDEEAS